MNCSADSPDELLHGAYTHTQVSRRPAPLYTFRKTIRRHPKTAKLTREEVTEIRRWARAEGFGLIRADQARVLVHAYPWMTSAGLAGVLRNEAFYDPTYDPNVPLPIEERAAPTNGEGSYLTTWVLVLALLLRTLCVKPRAA